MGRGYVSGDYLMKMNKLPTFNKGYCCINSVVPNKGVCYESYWICEFTRIDKERYSFQIIDSYDNGNIDYAWTKTSIGINNISYRYLFYESLEELKNVLFLELI